MTEYLIFEISEDDELEDDEVATLVDVCEADSPKEAVEAYEGDEVRFDVAKFFAVPKTYVHSFQWHPDGNQLEEKDLDLHKFQK